MAKDLLSRYIWLVDTIKRHGRITRGEIDEQWKRSRFSQGDGIPRRTFYNYRVAIEELFNLNIECDPSTYEYYITCEDTHSESMNNWVLNSAATSGIITGAHDLSGRIFLEQVPSARDHLGIFVEAIRESNIVRFDYLPYTRSIPTRAIDFEPYLLRIFGQRWYAVGRNVKEDKIKTYALDRVSAVQQLTGHFDLPAWFEPTEYFTDAFGIIVDHSEPRLIEIRTDSTQAKYLRALPLHHSQSEMVGDGYSIFTYRMRLTTDLLNEILSYGSRLTVLNPPELRAMVASELRKALKPYE